MTALRLYGRLAAASLRAKMQYKLDFLMNTLFYATLTMADFLMLAAIMLRFKEVGGWDIYEVGLSTACRGSRCRSIAPLRRSCTISTGTSSTGSLTACSCARGRPFSRCLGETLSRIDWALRSKGGVILGISANHLAATGALDVFGVTYVVAASIFGALIPFGLSLMTATLAFWMVRTGELQTFTMYAPVTASQYPLTVYPRWLKALLTSVLPVGFINFIPVRYLLGKGGSGWALIVSPAVAVAFTAVAYAFWRVGERHYHSTGS